MKYSSKHLSKIPLKEIFLERSLPCLKKAKPNRLPPLSLRLSKQERAELNKLANGQPLGSYIKKQIFGNSKHNKPQQKPIIHDQKSVARVLRGLAESDTIKTIDALAIKHNAENLTLSSEAEYALRQACSDISYMRRSLVLALGLKDSKNRDPRNFTLAEWQQAKRAGKNAKELKSMFQDCWSFSDNKTAFTNAILERGFFWHKANAVISRLIIRAKSTQFPDGRARKPKRYAKYSEISKACQMLEKLK